MTSPVTFEPVAIVHSPFKEKFGIPHQPGMTTSIISTIEFLEPFSAAEMVRGMEDCSHIWLLFIFSANQDSGWRKTVRPPRLGGKKKLGVFASRSPHRPNPIGLSPVKLEAIRIEAGRVLLDVSGADLLNGTPIIDIKPYLPESDAIDSACYHQPSSRDKLEYPVIFSEQAQLQCQQWSQQLNQPLFEQIIDTLQCDPRPGYKRTDTEADEKTYGILLYQLNIRWQISQKCIRVLSIEQHLV